MTIKMLRIIAMRTAVLNFLNVATLAMLGITTAAHTANFLFERGRQGRGIRGKGFVYAMQNGKFTKIGLSKNPFRRVKEIDKAFEGTKIIHMVPTRNMFGLEKAAHNHFSAARINKFHGREWFKMKPEKAVEFITKYK